MATFNNIKELVYGDRGIVLSSFNTAKKDFVNPLDVAQFLITLNDNDYNIKNADDLFKLNAEDFKSFRTELIEFLASFDIDGFLFTNSFSNSIELTKFTNEDWTAMFAQYSISYSWGNVFNTYFNETPESNLEKYFSKGNSKFDKLNTKTKQITVSFEYKKDLNTIIKNIIESKTPLREQQILTLKAANLYFIKKLYTTCNITIKDIEVLIIERLINEDKSFDHNVFTDIDQIARTVIYLYSFDKEQYQTNKKFVHFENLLNQQINNTMLKKLFVKMPTKMKKNIVKFLNEQKNIEKTVENMFKYYGFWKKIFSALKFDSEEKMSKNYPTYKLIKDKLYENDRSNTTNAKVENAKKAGDYYTAIQELSKNPGSLFRNLFEYLRYAENTKKAQKVKIGKPGPIQRTYSDDIHMNKIDFSSLMNVKSKKIKEDEDQETNLQQTSKTVINDGIEFFKNGEFSNMLMNKKVNTKLLWQSLSLFDDEKLYQPQDERYINAKKTYVHYDTPIPAITQERCDIVKKEIKKTIKRIKKEDNKNLGKVFIDKSLENTNIEFSGRGSNGITLSGEYLSPGSKIPFSKLVGQNKIIRLGIAWRGEKSCDIDHSLSLFKPVKRKSIYGSYDDQYAVYYGQNSLEVNEELIITSSGDITQCENELFSTELIDIDLDKAIEHGIGNMVTSAIQFSGLSLDNYEILWFMNIIDKKDRVTKGRQITISLDQMDYAIQINENTMSMLGFYIDMDNEVLEVLNMSLNNKMRNEFNNAVTNHDKFLKLLDNRPTIIPMDKAVKSVIKKSQIVDDATNADLIISCENIDITRKDVRIINPNTQREEINNIIF